MSLTSKTAFQFLGLPGELRDLVYHHLWTVTPGIAVPHEGLRWLVLYDKRFTVNPYSKLPRWLLTNKQFLKEGLKQLLLKSTWTFEDFEPSRLPKVMQKNSPLFVPFKTKEVHLNLEAWSHIALDDGYRPILSLEWLHVDLEPVAAFLKKKAKVESLQVRIFIPDQSKGYRKNCPREVDFALLEPFDLGLEKMVVRVESWEGKWREWHPELMASVHQEVNKVGKMVMGNNAGESFKIVEEMVEDEDDGYALDGAPKTREVWRFEFMK